MINEGLQNRKKESLQLKLELVREWTALFFDSPHRSVMTLLSSMRLNGIQKFDMNKPGHFFKEIKDIEDLLNDLKDGKLVHIQQYKLSKRDKKAYVVQLDFNFFKIIQELIRLIMDNIKPRLQKIKKIKQGQITKICKNCKTERTQTEIIYFGLKCRCTNTEFVVIEPNMIEYKRLSEIQSVLQTRFLSKKRRIEEIQRRLSKDFYRQRKNEQDKNAKLFEQFCQREKLVSIKAQNLIRSGNNERMRALHLYGRRLNFNSVNQLKLLNQLRRKNKEKEQIYPESMGTND